MAVDKEKNRTAIASQSLEATVFPHPLGVRRITAVHLASPRIYQRVPALIYLEKLKVVRVQRGEEWLLEVTFDGGKQGKSKDSGQIFR